VCFGLGLGECVCWGLQDFGLLSEGGGYFAGAVCDGVADSAVPVVGLMARSSKTFLEDLVREDGGGLKIRL